MLSAGCGNTGSGAGVVCELMVAPAWPFGLEEWMDREEDDGVGGGGGCEVLEALRLNCGCRRGRYFKMDVSIAAAGANVLPRREVTGIKAIVLSREEMFKSGRNEAILGLLR